MKSQCKVIGCIDEVKALGRCGKHYSRWYQRTYRDQGLKRFRRVRVPESGHPLVKFLFEEMNRQRIGIVDMAKKAGLDRCSFQRWQSGTVSMTIANLDACLNVLGFRIDAFNTETSLRRLNEKGRIPNTALRQDAA